MTKNKQTKLNKTKKRMNKWTEEKRKNKMNKLNKQKMKTKLTNKINK